VTDRELTSALASRRDPETTPVREVMAPAAVYCRDSDDLEDAAWLMERHQARRLIVLDRERHLAGVISVDDIARCETSRLAGDVLRHTSSRPLP
jgi:Mg/Co/Ni transporter MgtE